MGVDIDIDAIKALKKRRGELKDAAANHLKKVKILRRSARALLDQELDPRARLQVQAHIRYMKQRVGAMTKLVDDSKDWGKGAHKLAEKYRNIAVEWIRKIEDELNIPVLKKADE